MKIFFVGDIVGKPGRQVLGALLPGLVGRNQIDLVIANAENAAAGFGLTPDIARELFDLGVDILTSGNHIWDKRDIFGFLDQCPDLLRPANYPPGVPGRGHGLFSTCGGVQVGILNLEGRVFMNNLECPFRTADTLIPQLAKTTPIILVDFHAEATSEKIALAHYLDGRVSAVIGTHTHVQTADERIFSGGTAYITDAGMTGSRDSVIGVRKEIIIERFLHQLPVRFEVAKNDQVLNGVLLEIDEENGRGKSIDRVAVGLEEK